MIRSITRRAALVQYAQSHTTRYRFRASRKPDAWRGSATAATLHRELVQKRRWLTEEQFTLCFAVGRITPGTNLLAFCIGFGWLLRKGPGAVTALLASSIPCAVLVVTLTALLDYWQANPFAQAAIHGAVAAAVGVTVKTCWTIANPYFKGAGRLRVVLAGGAAFALHQWVGLSPIQVLIVTGVAGAFAPVHGDGASH